MFWAEVAWQDACRKTPPGTNCTLHKYSQYSRLGLVASISQLRALWKKRCSISLKKFMNTCQAGILQHSSLEKEQYIPCQNVNFLENSVMRDHISQ